MDVNDEWSRFLKDDFGKGPVMEAPETRIPDSIAMITPECSPIVISTKTKIIYLNQPIELFPLFWGLPMILYDTYQEGIIKKQIKFNFTTKEQVKEFDEHIAKVTHYKCVTILNQIDNPTGRVVFKDVRKVDIGLCKKDILKLKKNEKSAFYNCFVFIYRLYLEDKFKEIHIKLFNTGKIEIPGIQKEEHVGLIVKKIVDLLQPYCPLPLIEMVEKQEIILINSNFTCNYYINRDELYKILKKKYHIKCSYDPCSYPGIQCKYKLEKSEVSFMIFRTGSVLIVGKCEDEQLFRIYDFLKNVFMTEFQVIYEQNVEVIKKKQKKKIKKLYILENK
jgi:TATA-box binding protein (TBP) (component of TFIID and TFIIIB)